MPSSLLPAPGVHGGSANAVTLDIVVPVLHFGPALADAFRALHTFLERRLPFSWRITILDAADGTRPPAGRPADRLRNMRTERVGPRGLDAALKAGWRNSPAEFVACIDAASLAAEPEAMAAFMEAAMEALPAMMAPLVNGWAAIAIGGASAGPGEGACSRARAGRTGLASRIHRAVMRLGFGVGFTDPHYRIKIARTEAIRPLLDKIRDEAWYFDTELLLLAGYNGLTVHEETVHEESVREGPGATLARRGWRDLRALLRVTYAMATGRADADFPGSAGSPRPPAPPPAPARVSPRAVTMLRLVPFTVVGLVSGIVYALVYTLLRGALPLAAANFVALVVSTAFNTEANRRWTFNPARVPRVGMHLRATILFVVTYALTTAAVLAFHLFEPDAGRPAEVAVLLSADLLVTAARFIGLDRWVFRQGTTRKAADGRG